MTPAAPVVTALLRVSCRLLAVRAAVLYLVAAPGFVAWAGSSSTAAVEVRLRIVGLIAAPVAALLWEDRSTAVIEATPVGLPAVRRLRGLLVASLLVLGWSLAALGAGLRMPGDAAPALLGPGIEAIGLAALLLVLIGALASGRAGESVAAYPVPVLLVLLAVLHRLPARWNLLVITPGAPWSGPQTRWALLITVAGCAVAWLGRDSATAARPGRSRGSRAT